MRNPRCSDGGCNFSLPETTTVQIPFASVADECRSMATHVEYIATCKGNDVIIGVH